MKRFSGKTVVITGGTRGIGRELVRSFAREGANVAFSYRTRVEEAALLRREVEADGLKCLAFQAPVFQHAAVSAMMKAVNTEWGSIDILINNAGVLKVGAFAGMRYDDWEDLIETNLNGLFTVTKTALPYLMKKQDGVIINISSFMAYRPVGPAQAVYAATKAGVIGFSRALAREVSSVGVRVNVVAPGLVDTEMIKPLGAKVIDEILQQTTVKRLGTPEEISAVVRYLASNEARYVVGQTIVVDGGGVSYQF